MATSTVSSMSDARYNRYCLLVEVKASAQDRVTRAFDKTTEAFARYGGDTEIESMQRVHAHMATYLLIEQICDAAIAGRPVGMYF